MNLNAITNYIDKALKSERGAIIGLSVPSIVTVTAGALHLSKSLKTSTLPTLLICVVAGIATPIFGYIVYSNDLFQENKKDKASTVRWKQRIQVLTFSLAITTPLLLGGAALKYLAPHSSVLLNSSLLLGNYLTAALISFISGVFFQGDFNK